MRTVHVVKKLAGELSLDREKVHSDCETGMLSEKARAKKSVLNTSILSAKVRKKSLDNCYYTDMFVRCTDTFSFPDQICSGDQCCSRDLHCSSGLMCFRTSGVSQDPGAGVPPFKLRGTWDTPSEARYQGSFSSPGRNCSIGPRLLECFQSRLTGRCFRYSK